MLGFFLALTPIWSYLFWYATWVPAYVEHQIKHAVSTTLWGK